MRSMMALCGPPNAQASPQSLRSRAAGTAMLAGCMHSKVHDCGGFTPRWGVVADRASYLTEPMHPQGPYCQSSYLGCIPSGIPHRIVPVRYSSGGLQQHDACSARWCEVVIHAC